MFMLPFRESAKIVSWAKENIPDSALAQDGREHEMHVTVLFGFCAALSASDIAKLIQSFAMQTKRDSLAIELGAISRFSNPEHDVLKIEVKESGDLAELHHFLRELLEPANLIEVTHPTYNAHVTLAYVKTETCKELDGHCQFKGDVFTSDHLVYSLPGRKRKYGITLDGGVLSEGILKMAYLPLLEFAS